MIQSYIIKGTSQTNRGVKEQSLAMCNCDKMGVKAAALIEIGFMTNKVEADLMAGEAFCKEQGEDVAKAIIAYVQKYYPDMTSESTSNTTSKLYRVRESWDNAKSQVGAFAELDNAKNECDKHNGYTVYDWNGTAVYGKEYSEPKKIYRVRKSWDDIKSQVGAFSVLDNAKSICDQYKGYHVFDNDGKVVYSSTKSNDNVESDTEKENENVSAEQTTPEEPSESVTGTLKEEREIISPVYGFSREDFIEYLGEKANKDLEKTGILASITTAQGILESADGQSDLSLYANNIFGMKATLSGNTWASEWDGATYKKYSPEEDSNGNIENKLSTFRAYKTIEASIKDHSDYLNGAMKGTKLRYEGLKGETDYRIAAQIIKDGGYATDSKYVDKLCNLIEKYNLSRFDLLEEEVEEDVKPIEPELPDEEPIVPETPVVDEDNTTDTEVTDEIPEVPDIDEEIPNEPEISEPKEDYTDPETPNTDETDPAEPEVSDTETDSELPDEEPVISDESETPDTDNDSDGADIGEFMEDVNRKLDIITTIMEGIKSIVDAISNLLHKIFK